MPSGRAFGAALIAAVLIGCGFIPKQTTMDDPQVQRLVQAAQAFDRSAYGFSSMPKQASVSLELRPNDNYDALFSAEKATGVHTISFRKENTNYVWIGEQETFQGPKMYKTVDGTLHEQIALTYVTQKTWGLPLNQLDVTYLGEDSRLANRRHLTLSEVKPILKEWGS
jgi:hypothetical protein